MKERLRKRRLLIGLCIAGLVALYPFPTETVPAWTIQFVDEAGAPWRDITVEEHWRNPRLEFRENRQSLVTDENGFVRFPRRTTRAPLIVRVIGPAVNALHVHGYRHTYVRVVPQGHFLSNDPNEFYLPGDSLPHKRTLRCQGQEPCK